jgi:hypothetical protein
LELGFAVCARASFATSAIGFLDVLTQEEAMNMMTSIALLPRCSLRVLATGIWLAIASLAGPLCHRANAQEAPTEQLTQSEKARKKAAEIAEKLYRTTMKLNTDAAHAIGIVRGIVAQDPFIVIDALIDLLGIGPDAGPPDITVEQAKDEIIAELNKAREEELAGRTTALVRRFKNLLVDPQNMTFENRLGIYVEDAQDLFDEVRTIMNNGDPARAELPYHLAPAFNTVTSSTVVGMSAAALPQSSIDDILVDAINTNAAMVSDDDQYGGYLYNVAQKYAGPFFCIQKTNIGYPPTGGGGESIETMRYDMDLVNGWGIPEPAVPGRGLPQPGEPGAGEPVYYCDVQAAELQMLARFDADPIVYLIRRAVTDQQLSFLFP